MIDLTAVQTAVVQHALDVGGLYLKNAHLKQGVPAPPPRQVLEAPQTYSETTEHTETITTENASGDVQSVARTKSPSTEPLQPLQALQPVQSTLPVAPSPQVQPQVTVVNTPVPHAPTAVATAQPMATWKKVALGTVAGAGLAGAGFGLGQYLNSPDTTNIEVNKYDPNGFLLEYLEDKGYHLPIEKTNE